MFTRAKKHFDGYRLAETTNFMLKHHIKYHRDDQLGTLRFMFKVKKHFLSAFRRQVAEAVPIKMNADCSSHFLMNDKLEYNRCLIPDILELETPEESQLVHRINEDTIRIRRLSLGLWERWKKMGGGLPSLKEPRRHPNLNIEEMLRINLEDIQKEDLDEICLLYTSPSPRDMRRSRMPSSA